MIKRQLIIIIFFSFLYLTSKSQDDNPVIKEYKEALNAEKGYIITQQNEYKQGYIIISKDVNNSEYVDFLRFIKAEPVRFTKSEIKEYGYDEVVYVTMPYNNDIVFMRKMNENEPCLYYYKSNDKKEFYIKKNNELILLPQDSKELRDFLQEEMSECNISEQNSKLAIYNKKRLAYIFERNSACNEKRIPFFNYGVYIGLGVSNLKMDPNRVVTFYNENNSNPDYVSIALGNFDYEYHIGYSGGFYADIPLDVYGGKLSFHPEILIKRTGYKFKNNYYGEFCFDVNYYMTNLFVRYRGLDRKKSAFVEFGFGYSLIYEKNLYYFYNLTNQKYDVNPMLGNTVYGLGLGVGMSFPFSVRNGVDLSLRYTFLYSQEKMPTVSTLDLIVGFSF
ncbi:MAG TPA: hypothetical protein DCG75_10030 [Bacteroidales bacterium]|jgi:hypothetical protein|nr:hypothetical protein [Bacteroidales bacterium]